MFHVANIALKIDFIFEVLGVWHKDMQVRELKLATDYQPEVIPCTISPSPMVVECVMDVPE